jgi:hypothetical protein
MTGNRTSTDTPSRLHPFIVAGLVIGVVALVIALAGGYFLGWSWTGVSRETHLWDVMELLVLPFALGAVPLWLRTYRSRSRAWLIGLWGGLAVFAVLVVGGYLLDWEWTGFQDNHLWDWLKLLVLPSTLAGLSILVERDPHLTPGWRIAVAVAAVAFLLVVVGGYALGWTWTGFEDNTLWDWLGLFLVPFAVPAALIWYRAVNRSRGSSDGERRILD